MNIEITGSVKGEYFNEKLISPRELIKLFNIPIKEDGTNYFTLADRYKVKDKLNGGFRHSQGVSLAGEVSGSYNGESYILRAFDTKRPNPNGQGFLYFPRAIESFTGAIMPFSSNHLDLAVWAYLCPRCKESPFRTPGRDFHYAIHDPEMISKKQMEALKREGDLLNKIMEISDESVMNLARGMVVKGQQIGVTAESTPSSVRIQMFNLAKMDPDAFSNGLENAEFEYRGRIGRLYDKGIILSAPDGNGTIMKWNDGTQIIRVSRGQDAIEAIFQHSLSQPEQFFATAKKLEQKDNSETLAKNTDFKKVLSSIDGAKKEKKVEKKNDNDIEVVEVENGDETIEEGVEKEVEAVAE